MTLFLKAGMIYSNNNNSFKKAYWVAWYVYLAPLVSSVAYIVYDGGLLGDYSNSSVEDFTVLYQAALLYLAPLIFIVSFMALFSRENCFSILSTRKTFGALSVILLLHGLLVMTFGAIATGGDSSVSDFASLVRLLLSKVNPYYIFILVCFLAGRQDIAKICLLVGVIVLETVLQKSLQGYWILFIAIFMYVIRLYGQGFLKTSIILALPILISFHIDGVLGYVYEIRSDSRGSELSLNSKEVIFKMALGRINSLSSVYSIIEDECCDKQVDSFYSVSSFIQRFTGINLGGQTSPTQVFNDAVLGADADYAIFTGTVGSLFININSSLIAVLANSAFLLLELFILYKLIPWNGTRQGKLSVFMIVIYMPYLSGDSWELSILLQQALTLYLMLWLIAAVPRVITLQSSDHLRYKQPSNVKI
jgi:hypothetical protein